jgi:rRNA maturation endonuclease Nob1
MHKKTIKSEIGINVDYITDGRNIIQLRCQMCCKFIARNYSEWWCPHCGASFIPGITRHDLEETKKIMEIVDQMEKYNKFGDYYGDC